MKRQATFGARAQNLNFDKERIKEKARSASKFALYTMVVNPGSQKDGWTDRFNRTSPRPTSPSKLLYNHIVRPFSTFNFHHFRLCNIGFIDRRPSSQCSYGDGAGYCCSCRLALLTGCAASLALFPHPFTRICLY